MTIDAGTPQGLPTKRKRRKTARPSFDEFFVALQNLITRNDSRTLMAVVRMIKRGCSEEVRSEDFHRTIELLRSWSKVDRLAIRLAVDHRNGNLKTFAKQIANGLRLGFVRQLSYPMRGRDSNIETEILSWLGLSDNYKPNESGEPQEPLNNLAQAKRRNRELRMKFVCLVGESNDSLVYEGTYKLLRCFLIENNRKTFALNQSREFMKLLASVLGQLKISANAIKNILSSVAPMTTLVSNLQQRDIENTHKIETLQRSLGILEESEARLKEKISDTEDRNNRLTNVVSTKELEVAEWHRRYEALDQHWKEAVKEELTTQAANLKRKLSHEITEARLSLEGSQPDTQMASDRIRQMAAILEGLN